VHDLRHRFAIRWLRAGGNIDELSRHPGRKSVKTTEIYLGNLSNEKYGLARKGIRCRFETAET
jgi:integrase